MKWLDPGSPGQRLAALAALLLGMTSGCGGLRVSLGIGPTVDSDGNVGFEIVYTQGMRLRDSRAWVVSDLGGGYSSFTSESMVGFYLGADYAKVTPLIGQTGVSLSDSTLEPSSALSYRLGPRLGIRQFFGIREDGEDSNGLSVGASAALSYPVRRIAMAMLTSGLEAHCEVLVQVGDGESRMPRARCAAPLFIEVINAWRPPPAYY